MPLSEEELTQIVSRVVAELQEPTPTPLAIDPTHFQVLTGQVIAADHVNSLANQAVPKYPSLASLTADWPAPAVGSMAYAQDVNALYVYDAQITGGSNVWHILGGLRMGYAQMGNGQSIPGGSVKTLVKLTTAGGAAGKPGRSVWAADGSVTAPYTGTYLVTGNVTWPAKDPASGERRVYIQRYTAGAWQFPGTAGGVAEINTGAVGVTILRMGVTAMVACNAGDKIGMFAQHSANSALVLPGGTDISRLAVHMLGAE